MRQVPLFPEQEAIAFAVALANLRLDGNVKHAERAAAPLFDPWDYLLEDLSSSDLNRKVLAMARKVRGWLGAIDRRRARPVVKGKHTHTERTKEGRLARVPEMAARDVARLGDLVALKLNPYLERLRLHPVLDRRGRLRSEQTGGPLSWAALGVALLHDRNAGYRGKTKFIYYRSRFGQCECGRYFFRAGRGAVGSHCSAACGNAARQRNYRKKHKARIALSQRH
ncbi:MAG: hypothetical protein JSR73_10665 [Proteobacteria bacterium]|nr:hypothetical protein [Pseudomonadota bacterium]